MTEVAVSCSACASGLRGAYDLNCVACCARLVISARPSKKHQESMLAAIAGYKDGPTREQVIEAIKQQEMK